jgi:CheY-like chemotaxis protein
MIDKGKILLVEDEAINAMLLKRNMELLGYQICGPAATGEAAIQIAADEHPDVVLMDIRLAGKMDGIDAAREIISINPVPIIFLTGYMGQENLSRMKDIHPVANLVKPISPDDILPVLDQLFNHRVQPLPSNGDNGYKPRQVM